MSEYDDIINLPHRVSETRPHMSPHDRAGQFSPFAALTGFGDMVDDEMRETDSQTQKTEEEIIRINEVLNILKARPGVKVYVRYFVKDGKKAGGSYAEANSEARNISETEAKLTLSDGTVIDFDDIDTLEII